MSTLQQLFDQATTHLAMGRFPEALAAFDQVVDALQQSAAAGKSLPSAQMAEILFQRALTLESMSRTVEAMADYDAVLALMPGNANVWSNKGSLLRQQDRLLEAETCFRRALALDPHHIPARTNRGMVFTLLDRNTEAAAEFRRLLELDPDNPNALGGLLSASLRLCDWQTVESIAPKLARDAASGLAVVAPFQLTLAFADPALLHDATAHFVRAWLTPAAPRPPLRPDGGKIRLAYLSADFSRHATAHLVGDLFARHDRERFDVIGVSYGADDDSPARARLKAGFDDFLNVRALPDDQTAQLLRDMGVDIAVDLKGYTLDARPGILAHGAAPLQVSWLGYPGTLAAALCDYVIADPQVLPRAEQSFWDEKIIHLPNCYQVNDPLRAHDAPMTRAEAGLPGAGMVFGCFNNHAKIARPQFEIWMRLLAAVPGSVLWLLDDSANDALRAHAAARGIEPARLVFAPRLEAAMHLRRLPCADLMLDTLPYNMHTTASDALWMGVPVITFRGTAFAGRVAASLLTAMECPELVTETPDAYEALALALARDPARLAALKDKLAHKRLTTPLFDAPRFCRHLERAYVTMMEIARAGEPPRPFNVSPDS